ncbi:MAG TPA: HRDC domain-containing protein [Kofleriaceae bacterium]
MTVLLAEPAEVAALAAAVAKSPLVTFDLEFLTADRLVPTLCLAQVSWLPHDSRLDVPAQVIVATPPEVALIDAIAVDLRPLVEALAAHPLVVVHAARQDLGILAARFGIAMPNIIDTQVMAAFAGVGDQVGLASLANELLGLTLGKEQQWTDWARRPLSDAQLAYADADVRHLPAIYALLAARLGDRVAWARAESAEVAADAVAAASVTPETAWRNVGGLRGLDANALAAVIVLAEWRQRIAMEHDRPLPQVLNDKGLVDLARARPDSPEAVRGIKTVTPFARKYAEAIVTTLATARPDEVSVLRRARSPSARAQRWSEMLLAITQLVAEQTGVAPRLLATRADAEELARVIDERGVAAAEDLPAMQSWRRDVIGARWLGWLTGELVLVGDATAASGLALLPR